MKMTLSILAFVLLLLWSPCVALAAAMEDAGIGKSFKGPLGVQLYSFRNELAKDVTGTLARVHSLGFHNVELAGTYGMTPEAFRAALDKASLKAVSMHVSLEDMRDKIDQVIKDAKVLGPTYVGVAWIKRSDKVSLEDVNEAADILNRAGEKLNAAGMKAFYHIHGYEFQPVSAGGTFFDSFMSRLNPQYVDIQMDIFWAVHGGQDPVKLFQKYPGRITSMHLKDMRKDVVGDFTGVGKEEYDVALGTGKIEFKSALKAAKKSGVKWYFIEDESPSVYDQIPRSLKYLEQVSF